VKQFHSATEVKGSNGAVFLVDEGTRVDVTLNDSKDTASDPDIFKGPNGYILYIFRGSSVQVLSSPTLRGSYTNIRDLPNGLLVSNFGGIPAGHYDASTGKYWTYIHTLQGIKRAVHSSLDAQLQDSQFSTVISGSTFPGFSSSYLVESPGFAVNTAIAEQ